MRRVITQPLRNSRIVAVAVFAAMVTVSPALLGAQPGGTATPCATPHVDARVVRAVEPEYPERPRSRGIGGVAQVKVTIDTTGAVVDAVIYKSSGDEDLDQAAIRAAKKTTFTPEFENCRPIAGAYLFRAAFAAGLPRLCPVGVAAAFPITDMAAYVILLSTSNRTTADVRLTFYTAGAAYVADATSINFNNETSLSYPFRDALRRFQAEPVFVRLPAPVTVDAVSAEAIDPSTKAEISCLSEYSYRPRSPYGMPSTSDLPPSIEFRRAFNATRDAIIARLKVDTPTISAQPLSTLSAPSCSAPYKDALMTSAVAPDYPEAARRSGATGIVIVMVGISETGKVIDARVTTSSGNVFLDSAAVVAARASRYAPQVFRCNPIAGYYAFRATFATQ